MLGNWATKSLTWADERRHHEGQQQAGNGGPGQQGQDGPDGARDVEKAQPRRGRGEGNRDDERDRHEHDDLGQLLEQQAGGEQTQREDDGPIRDPGIELGVRGCRPVDTRSPPPLRR